MGEGVKAGFPVIIAHSAFFHAPERHVRSRKVDDCVVNTTSAMGNAVEDVLFLSFTCSKEVQSKRFGSRIYFPYNLIQAVELQYRKNRSEDFLLHDGGIPIDLIQDRRFNPVQFRIGFSSIVEFSVPSNPHLGNLH